jgi:hypothetical protein
MEMGDFFQGVKGMKYEANNFAPSCTQVQNLKRCILILSACTVSSSNNHRQWHLMYASSSAPKFMLLMTKQIGF